MSNYDQWKLDNPYDDEDKVFECAMCDAPIENEGGYCSKKCRDADN